MSGTQDRLRKALEEQHERVKAQLQLVQDTHGEARAAAFLELRRFLAAHETVEQAVMHPTVRDETRAAQLVEQRVAEEGEATSAIEALEQFDVDSDDFSDRFASLAQDVVAHAEAEEHVELPAFLARAEDGEMATVLRALGEVDSVAAGLGGGVGGTPGFAGMLQQAKAYLETHPVS
jgi:hypothetical protein